MHVANLQLQGLLMAMAGINRLLVEKGLVEAAEIDEALRRAEAVLSGEDRLFEDMSPANRDAACFPLRLLQLANQIEPGTDLPGFADLARKVGQTKEPYNDQR